MSLLNRPDCVVFPYTRACMFNHMLDRGIYIYLQIKHIAQSYSTEDMNTPFMIVYCIQLLTHLGQNEVGQITRFWFLLCVDVITSFRLIIIHCFNLFILGQLILLMAISMGHYYL